MKFDAGRHASLQRLVWHARLFDVRDAIDREKQLKKWRREWKIALIEAMNPEWNELFRGTGRD